MLNNRNDLNKGITLVALVVTIIIMIILATITINATIGDNGILTRTVNSKTDEQFKQAQDEVEQAVKRKDYYAVNGADTGVSLSYFSETSALQKYINGRINGATSTNGKVSKVYYTNDIGSFTVMFDEKGTSKVLDGIYIENGNKDEVLVIGNNESIFLTTNSEDFYWSSSDRSVLEVNSQTGEVKRLKPGKAIIYGAVGDAAREMDETGTVNFSKMSIRVEVYDETAVVTADKPVQNTNVISEEELGLIPSGGAGVPGSTPANNTVKIHCGNNCYAQVLNGDTLVFYVDKSVRVSNSEYGEIALWDSDDESYFDEENGFLTLGSKEKDLKIKKIIFNEGITSIDCDVGNSFINCKEIVIPKTTNYVDLNAFWEFDESEDNIIGITNCDKLIFNSSYNVIQDIYTDDKHYGFEFTGNESFKYITAFSPIGIKELEIGPDVTTLGNGVFSYCKSLKSVSIPSNVKEVKNRCFYNCTGINNLNFENGINTIGKEAFRNCISIKDLSLPKSLKTIDEYAFLTCMGIELLNLKSVENIKKGAFQNCTKLEEFTFPENVKSIDPAILTSCSSIKVINYNAIMAEYNSEYVINESGWISSFKNLYQRDDNYVPIEALNIGSKVKKLSACLFAGVKGVKNINIANGLEEIGDGTFMNCSGFTSIKFPNSIKKIGIEAFAFCGDLSNVSFNEGLEDIERWAFSNCVLISSITFPESVKTIGKCAFSSCDGLRTINYNAVEADYTGVLYSDDHRVTGVNPLCMCYETDKAISRLQNIIIGNKVKVIPRGLFAWCDKVETVDLPDSVKIIGEAAFLICKNLSNINLNKVEIIQGYAFSWCEALRELTIPESVTDMYYYCFKQTSNLQTLYYNAIHCTGHFQMFIEDGSYSLYPFQRENQVIISNVPNIIIGNKVEFIPDDIFRHAAITEITIPSNVNEIECSIYGADKTGPFTSCTELNKIIVNKPENSIPGAPWSNRTGIQVIWNP